MTKSRLIFSYALSVVGRVILSPLKLLPVNRNKVLFLSFRGKQYSCNPKAISEALNEISGDKIDIVWAFHEPEKFESLKSQGIRVISDRGLKFAIEALTARVVCTNTYYKPHIPRRKNQFYLRTWHGGGAYKRVDYPKGLKGAYIKMQQSGANLYLSSSKAFSEMTLRGSFGYKGEILELGMPRNDMLINGQWKKIGEEVKKQLNCSDKRIALYAPTYRESLRDLPALDVKAIKQALVKHFGGEWVLFYRGHHTGLSPELQADGDLSAYPDMQPLLAAADVLITDYSSSVWDMSLMYKPAMLYCPDIDDYASERDFYTAPETWPFALSKTNEKLSAAIQSFDESKYIKAVKEHHRKLGICESGQAAKACAMRIMRECGEESAP